MSDPPPPPSPDSERERAERFARDVMAALVEAHAKIDALDRRHSNQTLILAIVALVAQIVGSNLWRLGYVRPARAPTPAVTAPHSPSSEVSRGP